MLVLFEDFLFLFYDYEYFSFLYVIAPYTVQRPEEDTRTSGTRITVGLSRPSGVCKLNPGFLQEQQVLFLNFWTNFSAPWIFKIFKNI